MRKLIFIVFIISNYLSVIGCSCSGASEHSMGERTMEWWNASEYVFRATLDSVITIEGRRPQQQLFFTILKDYKGNAPIKLNFYSPNFGSSCEWDLKDKTKNEFIIYGHKDESGDIISHFCSGSKQILEDSKIDSVYGKTYSSILLKQEMKFIKDVEYSKNRTVKTYYSNGNLTSKGKLSNYKPVGYWEYYTFENNIISKGFYENGNKNGIWFEYDYSQEQFFDKNNNSSYKLVLKSYNKVEYLDGVKIRNLEYFKVNN